MPEWRNDRDGKIGIAMNGGASSNIETRNDENDNSDASNSWCRI
jgi:hypothetical protein